MKRWGLTFAIFLFPFLVGCSTGGGGTSPEKAINPFGFNFSSFTSSTNPGLSADVRSVAVSGSGDTIFAGAADGLYSVTTGLTPVITKISDAGLTNQSINCLSFESSGDLLIGTDKGLFRRSATTKTISGISGLEASQVLSLAVQGDGTIWAGLYDPTSTTNSVAKAAPGGTFTFFGTSSGMTASAVVYIYADTDLVVACGQGTNGGLFQFTGSKFKAIDDLSMAGGASLFFRNGETWYAGGPGAGLYSSATTGGVRKWTLISGFKDLTPNWFVIEPNQQGNFRYWVATNKGLAMCYDLSGGWVVFNKSSRLSAENCKTVMGVYGTVWIANPAPGGGVSRGSFVGD